MRPLLSGLVSGISSDRRRPGDEAIRRVAADPLETMLRDVISRIAPPSSTEPLDLLARVEVHSRSLHVLLPIRHLPAVRGRLDDGERVEPDPVDPSRLRLTLPIRVRFHGGRTRITTSAGPTTRPDTTLIRALRQAHTMVARDAAGHPMLDAAPDTPWRRRLVRLAFLAPELQRAILAGRQPPDLTLNRLMDSSMPLLWSKQAEAFDVATTG